MSRVQNATMTRARSGSEGAADQPTYSAPLMLLTVGLVVVLVVGVWGLLAPRGDEHAEHPRVGQSVAVDGGHVRVDAVRDVDLSAPMAGPGMQMGPSSGVPDIPDGYRWVAVDVTAMADDGDPMTIDTQAYAVTGEGLGRLTPVDVDEGGTLVPAGGELARTLFFEVPEESAQLMLWGPGAQEPVMMSLGAAPAPHGHASR